MNKRQRLFILILLSKLAMLATLYFGFWAFIYQFAWWNKPLWFALMSSAVSFVLCVVCFCGWITFEMWIRDPSTLPRFKIERGERTEEPEEGIDAQVEEKEEPEKLPLY